MEIAEKVRDLGIHGVVTDAQSGAPLAGINVGANTGPFERPQFVAGARTGPDAELVPVAKRSPGKSTVGGRKWAFRTDDGGEVLRLRHGGDGAPLQQPLPATDQVETARTRCAAALAALPEHARRLDAGTPVRSAQLEEDA